MANYYEDQMLRVMCDTVPDMIWSKNIHGEYIFANQAICDNLLSAKNTNEPIGKNDMFFALRERASHPTDPEWHTFGELCHDSDAITIEAGKPMQFFEYGNIKGKFVYLDVRKAPLRDESGNIIGVVGSGRDITHERAHELEIKKLSQAIEQAGESVIITDKHGMIEYVNSSFTRITGYQADEAVGKSPRFLKSGNQSADYYKKMWKTISNGKAWHASVINRRKDGTQYPAAMSISPIFNGDEITHYVAFQQDMSEQELLEEKFQQAQKMEALGTLVGGIAHDFNNMLAGMTGHLYLAKNKLTDSPEVSKHLESVEKLSFSAAEMIKQLLIFSRHKNVESKLFGLTSFMKEISKLCESSIPDNIKFNQHFCNEELVIKGNPTQLQQILMNLLNNARDAASNVLSPNISLIIEEIGVENITHKNSYFNGRKFAHLVVSDNGIGISATDKERIFEPFYTTKIVGNGTGLGLAMSYGAVKGMGGRD